MLSEYVKGREEDLTVRAKNLATYSDNIAKGFESTWCQPLFEKFKIRTSKYIQELESFLDLCFLAKLYLKTGLHHKLK